MSFKLPLANVPEEGEEAPRLLELPPAIAPRPSIGLDDDGPAAGEVRDFLRRVLAALRSYRVGTESAVLPLDGLSPTALAALADTLGEGEVRAEVHGGSVYELRETALPAVWRVTTRSRAGALQADQLEVADIPAVVRAAAEEATHTHLDATPPAGGMNVGPLLVELAHRAQTWQPGEPNHVISLTLLPMNDVDLDTLARRLGKGPFESTSEGYGRCRIELTAQRRIWNVQFFNVMGTPILDTLEVGDVPAALLAGQEDVEDSAVRLGELLGESA